MKKFALLILTVFLLVNCTKEAIVIIPTSDFSFPGEYRPTFTMATQDECAMTNNSENGVSYLWDFGDGRQSEEVNPIISYNKPGAYSITLTTQSRDGELSISSKDIKVMDRVLKKIVIRNVNWKTTGVNGWPTDSVVDIYFQIQNYTDSYESSMKIFPNCEILYKSEIIENIPVGYNVPIEIYLNDKLVIERDKLDFVGHHSLRNCYIFSIMAVDSNGELFCIHNNHTGGGNSFGIMEEDINKNNFMFEFGLPFSWVQLYCRYE